MTNTKRINWKLKYEQVSKLNSELIKNNKETILRWGYTLKLWNYYMQLDWLVIFMMLIGGFVLGLLINI